MKVGISFLLFPKVTHINSLIQREQNPLFNLTRTVVQVHKATYKLLNLGVKASELVMRQRISHLQEYLGVPSYILQSVFDFNWVLGICKHFHILRYLTTNEANGEYK